MADGDDGPLHESRDEGQRLPPTEMSGAQAPPTAGAENRSCPNCGRRFAASRGRSKRARRLSYTFAGLLVLALVGTAVAIRRAHDKNVKKQHEAGLRERLARQEQTSEEASLRKLLEARVERAIALDARKLARAGVLEGPIVGATCTPMNGPSAIVVSSSTTSYNCIAIRRRRGRTIEGARFFATINARTGGWTFGGD